MTWPFRAIRRSSPEPAREIPFREGFTSPLDATRDGRYLLVLHGPDIQDLGIWIVPVGAPGGEPIRFSRPNRRDNAPKVSPDDRYLAYTSITNGINEIYIRAFPDGSTERRVSTGGGEGPVWGPDGRELFFTSVRQGTRYLMRVDVPADRESPVGTPEAMFAHPTLRGGPAPFGRYAVSADGQQILTVERIEPPSESRAPVVWLIENWGRGLASAN